MKTEKLSDTITIINADCRDVLPVECAAVVTDPPYGCGCSYASYDDTEANWFDLIHSTVPLIRKCGKCQVMPIGNRYAMGWWYENHAPDWLIAWHKGSPGHRSPIGFNDWEPMAVWGRPIRPMHDYFSTRCGFEDNGHPCPKPVEWASWLVNRVCEYAETVCDPFMGSGTTGIACIRARRRFIGIEKDAKYYEISKRRLNDELAQTNLFGEDEDARAGQGECPGTACNSASPKAAQISMELEL